MAYQALKRYRTSQSLFRPSHDPLPPSKIVCRKSGTWIDRSPFSSEESDPGGMGWVGGGGGVGTPNNRLYERGTLFTLQVYKRVVISRVEV